MSRTSFLAGVPLVALAVILCGGCFKSLDTSNLACSDNRHCPAGYTCVGASPNGFGKCTTMQISDASTQVPSPTLDSAGGGDGMDEAIRGWDASEGRWDTREDGRIGLDAAEDASRDVPFDLPLAQPDVPSFVQPDVPPEIQPDVPPDVRAPLKTQGEPCQSGDDCASPWLCVDGFCCNQTCTGCKACSKDLNGQENGSCLPVQSGKSAHNACSADGTVCGSDGTCNGAGQCHVATVGTACGSTCAAPSTFTPKACDGSGHCVDGTANSCSGELTCLNTSACKTRCSGNADCVSNNCDVSTGLCGNRKRQLGSACDDNSLCESGVCNGNGICCDRTCTGVCEQCTTATGGYCRYSAAGTHCDDATACLNEAACTGTSGSCPARLPKSTSTPCGSAATCNGSVRSASFCNGQGSCGAPVSNDCAPFACVAGACKTTCASHTDCVADSAVYCGVLHGCVRDTTGSCWRDLATNLLWEADAKSPWTYPDQPTIDTNYIDAPSWCGNLHMCGFADWHVPTLNQLRTLVTGCPSISACGVTNGCLGEVCESGPCDGCTSGGGLGAGGTYMPAALKNPTVPPNFFQYWSSSSYTSDKYGTPMTFYRSIDFAAGAVRSGDMMGDKNFVRCVR